MRVLAPLARLGCLGFVLASLAGCALAGPMYQDLKELRETMRSKDDVEETERFRLHDFLPAEKTPTPGVDIRPGQFLDVNGTVMDVAAVGEMAARADYVLIGEGHTVPCDHLVQAELLRAMAKAGKPPVVGLEMVDTEHRNGLHGFNIGRYGPEALDRALDWENAWGHPYSLYRPVFDAAHELGLKLEALNLSRDIVRAVSRDGVESLDPVQSAQLPVAVLPAMQAQREYLEEEFQRHRDMRAHGSAENATRDESEALERFLLVQSLWDTKMAEEAVHARRLHGSPVAVLAGAGHVEYGWGIALRLNALDSRAKVMTVMPWRGGPVDRSQATIFFHCPMSHASRLGFVLEMGEQGALITAVEPESRAEAAGLAKGDVILKAQGEPVDEMLDLHMAAIKARKAGENLVLTVRRDEAEMDVPIPPVRRRRGRRCRNSLRSRPSPGVWPPWSWAGPSRGWSPCGRDRWPTARPA